MLVVKNSPVFINGLLLKPARVNLLKRTMLPVSVRLTLVQDVPEGDSPREFILYTTAPRLENLTTREVLPLSGGVDVAIVLSDYEHELSESGQYIYVQLDKQLPPVPLDYRAASKAQEALKKLTGAKAIHLQW